MIYCTLKAIMASILTIMMVGCATTEVIRPAPKIPCPTCPTVEIRQCYEDTMGIVVFFQSVNEDGSMEVIPAPLIEPGCRCTMILNDEPMFVNTLPAPPEFCAEHKAEEEPEKPKAETQVHGK